MIYSWSIFIFYAESQTRKRIVGELAGWNQHPWNMNISSSSSHHEQTRALSVPTRTVRCSRCFNFAASERGLAAYSPNPPPRDMGCCMVIRQTLSRYDRDGETSSRGLMRPRLCCKTRATTTKMKEFLHEPRGTKTSWKMMFTQVIKKFAGKLLIT